MRFGRSRSDFRYAAMASGLSRLSSSMRSRAMAVAQTARRSYDNRMTASHSKAWVWNPPKSSPPKVPAALKAEVEKRSQELIDKVLKPEHVKPRPKDHPWNYIVDLFTKWHHSYFYFCAKYCAPGPHAISPDFETKFARLEYAGEGRFNLSFMRHTGQWVELYPGLSLESCLCEIQAGGFFTP